MKYGFIGFGHLAQAIYQGLKTEPIEFGYISKENTQAEPRAFESIEALAAFADVLWICVKPQDVVTVLQALRSADLAKKMIVSPVAGKTIRFIEDYLGADTTIARIMPNLAMSYGKSVTAYADNSESEITVQVKSVLAKLGEVFELPERHFDLFTAIFGSGPAFLLETFGVYQKKIMELGLPRDRANELLEELLDGTMTYLQRNGDKTIAELVSQIASKGGTTEAGLNLLKERNLAGLLEEVIEAAKKRSEELSR